MIEANSEYELNDILCSIDISVPRRNERRTKDHTEKYAICYLLSTLLNQGKLSFPLSLCKSERPDFFLKFGNREIGIEHTEAVAQNVAQSDALREQGHGQDVLYMRRSFPDEKKLKSRDLIKEMEENETSGGWIGNSVERDWTAAMSHFASKKRRLAKKEGFKIYKENWLLIYDNWRLPNVILEEAMPMFLEKCISEKYFDTFSCIYVILSDKLCLFSSSQTEAYKLNQLS